MRKEIIIIDDYSTDGTKEILKKLVVDFRKFFIRLIPYFIYD